METLVINHCHKSCTLYAAVVRYLDRSSTAKTKPCDMNRMTTGYNKHLGLRNSHTTLPGANMRQGRVVRCLIRTAMLPKHSKNILHSPFHGAVARFLKLTLSSRSMLELHVPSSFSSGMQQSLMNEVLAHLSTRKTGTWSGSLSLSSELMHSWHEADIGRQGLQRELLGVWDRYSQVLQHL